MELTGDRLLRDRVAARPRRWFDNDAGRFAAVAPRPGPARIDWLRVVPFIALHLRPASSYLGRRQRDGRGGGCRAVRAAHVRDHRRSTTATSRTARSAPRARRSSCSRCSAPPPCSAARCGGRRTIATTTRTPTTPHDAHSRAPARLPLEPHGLVPGARELRHAQRRWCPTSRAIPSCASSTAYDVLVPLALAALLYARGRMRWRRRARARDQRPAAARVGLLHLDGRAVPRHLHDQLARAPLRRGAATRPRRLAQQPCGSRCSPSARAGTTTTIIFRARRARASTGGRSTSPTTGCALLAALGVIWDLQRRCRRRCATRAAAAERRHEDRDHRQRHRRQRRRAPPAPRARRSRCSRPATHVGGHTHTHDGRVGRRRRYESTPASSSSTTGPTRTSSRCSSELGVASQPSAT